MNSRRKFHHKRDSFRFASINPLLHPENTLTQAGRSSSLTTLTQSLLDDRLNARRPIYIYLRVLNTNATCFKPRLQTPLPIWHLTLSFSARSPSVKGGDSWRRSACARRTAGPGGESGPPDFDAPPPSAGSRDIRQPNSPPAGRDGGTHLPFVAATWRTACHQENVESRFKLR